MRDVISSESDMSIATRDESSWMDAEPPMLSSALSVQKVYVGGHLRLGIHLVPSEIQTSPILREPTPSHRAAVAGCSAPR